MPILLLSGRSQPEPSAPKDIEAYKITRRNVVLYVDFDHQHPDSGDALIVRMWIRPFASSNVRCECSSGCYACFQRSHSEFWVVFPSAFSWYFGGSNFWWRYFLLAFYGHHCTDSSACIIIVAQNIQSTIWIPLKIHINALGKASKSSIRLGIRLVCLYKFTLN